jgi:RimJ/RimL family protein N-acetyltransferase
VTHHSAAVPVVETTRLILRAFRESDLDAWSAAMADPQVVRFLGGQPYTREETWRRAALSTGLWSMLGYGYWAVEAKEDGRIVGQIGFADFKRDISPNIEGRPEIGWIFAPEAQGRGYASEAALAALAWADEALGRREIVAIISHANAASIRIAEKGGFGEREEAVYKGEPILLFRRHLPL